MFTKERLLRYFFNFQRGAFVSEPAILVKYNDETSQVWSMEKLDLKLIDMRELYDELKGKNLSSDLIGIEYPDPFSENTENHSLIGVANVFLNVLFQDVNLDYHTPIISQQGILFIFFVKIVHNNYMHYINKQIIIMDFIGEVAGRLQIQIQRVSGTFAQDSDGSDTEDSSNPSMTVQVFYYCSSSFSFQVSEVQMLVLVKDFLVKRLQIRFC